MMKRNNRNKIKRYQKLSLIVILLAVMAVFVFMGTENEYPNIDPLNDFVEEAPIKRSIDEFFTHKTICCEISGLEQVINVIEVDISKKEAVIKPAFSYNRLFGFEPLEEIIQRHDAHAAINGGFFYEFGNPSGMVMIDSKPVTGSDGEFPVLIIEEGRARFEIIETEFTLRSNEGEIITNHMNVWAKKRDWVIYTSMFGTDNRIDSPNISVIIENDEVTGIKRTSGPVDIPSDGMVISMLDPYDNVDIPFKTSDEVSFSMFPQFASGTQAYECGSMIVKDFMVTAPLKDQWVGILTNRDPRTAVGIKEDGKILLVTVDGRQPGYSYGLTAEELAELLIELGAKDAAMLDGGASTQMIIEGKTINRPSFRGEGRPLAGGFIVQIPVSDHSKAEKR